MVFQSWPDGTHRYIAFSYGMLSQEESFTVQGAGIEKTLNLEKAPTKQVTFDIKPSDANETITIMQNGQVTENLVEENIHCRTEHTPIRLKRKAMQRFPKV